MRAGSTFETWRGFVGTKKKTRVGLLVLIPGWWALSISTLKVKAMEAL
jgi:hypothetical protein